MVKVVVLVGATAVGKTSLSINLAQRCNGEIISADSMQVYKHLNIGTAKITAREQQGIKHHLLDIVEPTQSFSVADYQALAYKAMDEIAARGKTPIIVGGTGLYINSVIYGYDFTKQKHDPLVRKYLSEAAEKYGNEALLKSLKCFSPQAAARLHVNDRKRIIRALEVYIQTGKIISSKQQNRPSEKYKYLLVGLHMDKQQLNERINLRVDLMVKEGLIQEVTSLYAQNQLGPVAKQALGYKEVVDYLRGKVLFDEMIEIIKLETRKYAKRQRVWFKKNTDIIWYNVNELGLMSNLVDNIMEQLAGI